MPVFNSNPPGTHAHGHATGVPAPCQVQIADQQQVKRVTGIFQRSFRAQARQHPQQRSQHQQRKHDRAVIKNNHEAADQSTGHARVCLGILHCSGLEVFEQVIIAKSIRVAIGRAIRLSSLAEKFNGLSP